MTSTKEVKLDLKFYEQVGSSNDFNPEKIKNTINKLFIFNKTATEHSKYTDTFFNLDQKNAQASSTSASVGGGFSMFGIGGSIQGSGLSSSSSSNVLSNIKKDTYSSKDVQDLPAKEKIESEWTGEKWVPKSLYGYKITDVTDYLQIGIIAK
ncbi:unnamed protein product [Rotaria socialis]|uniref:Uncharacterized protein n=1 Tax=Rotaria socialis TaxID=392032 RepID=A0A817YTF9_9BILA|nr:unnamed protein product [Rotaria socialis]CAF4127482.1 unnamed protein product [Rotaria socialis]